MSTAIVTELIEYSLQKRRFLQKRRRDADDDYDAAPSHRASRRAVSWTSDEQCETVSGGAGSADISKPARSKLIGISSKDGGGGGGGGGSGGEDGEEGGTPHFEPPGFLDLLANGREGPVRLGFEGGSPVAIKVRGGRHRGSPPEAHPHVNQVVKRLSKGAVHVEIRSLCEGEVSHSPMLPHTPYPMLPHTPYPMPHTPYPMPHTPCPITIPHTP